MTDFHSQFLTLVDEIETSFPVADWRVGDVPVWPLARTSLYSNLYRQRFGTRQKAQVSGLRRLSGRIAQAASYAATPLTNIWQSRGDLRHMILLPHRANAIFAGDGDSLDFIDGSFRDRFSEPLISYLQNNGQSTLLMQRGEICHLPWSRPTFAANTIIHWGRLSAEGLRRSSGLAVALPDHQLVRKFLDSKGVPIHGLAVNELRDRAAVVAATAFGFEQLLKIVRPSLCFMVAYYVRMGHALALACRRRGVLSVELQREGRGAQHEAYHWSAVPQDGYAIVPAVFWNWTEDDAAAIDVWSQKLKMPWHRSLYGGHPQLSAWFDDNDPETRASDAKIDAARARAPADREILVALQTLDGHDAVWNALAALIEASPPHWRWWLRRHPNTVHLKDRGLGRLLTIRRPNVLIDEASSVPLPGLLRRMDVLLSLRSGAAVEASLFGLKPIFLSQLAREMFPHLLETGKAEIVDDMTALEERLASVSRAEKTRVAQPKLSDVFSRLNGMAADYSALRALEHP